MKTIVKSSYVAKPKITLQQYLEKIGGIDVVTLESDEKASEFAWATRDKVREEHSDIEVIATFNKVRIKLNKPRVEEKECGGGCQKQC
jgi:hypothetical protein